MPALEARKARDKLVFGTIRCDPDGRHETVVASTVPCLVPRGLRHRGNVSEHRSGKRHVGENDNDVGNGRLRLLRMSGRWKWRHEGHVLRQYVCRAGSGCFPAGSTSDAD